MKTIGCPQRLEGPKYPDCFDAEILGNTSRVGGGGSPAFLTLSAIQFRTKNKAFFPADHLSLENREVEDILG